MRKVGKVETEVKVEKLDGVGPVDNRPSADKLHHFVQKKDEKKEKREKKKIKIHVTHDM